LRVKNKEINVERKRRKEEYRKEQILRKIKEDDEKLNAVKEQKRAEREIKYLQQVKAEKQMLRFNEKVEQLYFKNDFDEDKLEGEAIEEEERIKEMKRRKR